MKAVVDRIVQYANRYQITNVETGEVLGTFDFEEVTGTVQQVGTEIDKELFDSIANDLAARVKLSGGELAETIVTFPDISGTAENVASGDTSATLWGKVKNWFSRLKALAFKNKVSAGDFEAGAIKNADVAADAAIAQSKVSGLMTDYVASISVSGSTVTYKNKNGANMGNVNITKANVGLGNVDNTSDANKPVSTAQAATIKAVETKADDHIKNKENPHNVTRSQVDATRVDVAGSRQDIIEFDSDPQGQLDNRAHGISVQYNIAGGAGWYRLFNISRLSSPYIVNLGGGFHSNPAPDAIYALSHAIGDKGEPKLVQLLGETNKYYTTGFWDKVRVVYDPNSATNAGYFEVYKRTTTRETIRLTVIPDGLIDSKNLIVYKTETAGSIPEGYTAKEYPLKDGMMMDGNPVLHTGEMTLSDVEKLQVHRNIGLIKTETKALVSSAWYRLFSVKKKKAYASFSFSFYVESLHNNFASGVANVSIYTYPESNPTIKKIYYTSLSGVDLSEKIRLVEDDTNIYIAVQDFGNYNKITATILSYGFVSYSLSDFTIESVEIPEPSSYTACANGIIQTSIDSKYTKPSTGIPETDLAQDVKDKLNKSVDISGKADKTYVDAELAKKQDKGDYALKSDVPTIKVNSAANADTAGAANTATNYNTSSGNIKSTFDSINARLASLGFSQGSVVLSGGSATKNKIYKSGIMVYVEVEASISSSGLIFTIPYGYRPVEAKTIYGLVQYNTGTGVSWGGATFTISTNGEVRLYGINNTTNKYNGVTQVRLQFGYNSGAFPS